MKCAIIGSTKIAEVHAAARARATHQNKPRIITT